MSKSECEYPTLEDTCEGEVKLRKAMTAYPYNEEERLAGKEDPNKDFYACDYHWRGYHDHWREMWNEYYHSQGFGVSLPEYGAQDHIEPEVAGDGDDF